MAHDILPTLAIAVVGLFAARIGDRLRTPLFGNEPCDHSEKNKAWIYNEDAAQQEGAWREVHRHGTC